MRYKMQLHNTYCTRFGLLLFVLFNGISYNLDSQKSQAISNAIRCPLEPDSKNLLLKILHT